MFILVLLMQGYLSKLGTQDSESAGTDNVKLMSVI